MKLCTCFVLLRVILSGVFVRFYLFQFENIQTSLVVQWIRLYTSIAGGTGSLPCLSEIRSHKLHSTNKQNIPKEVSILPDVPFQEFSKYLSTS